MKSIKSINSRERNSFAVPLPSTQQNLFPTDLRDDLPEDPRHQFQFINDAYPYGDGTSRYVVAMTRYRLKPTPRDPAAALTLVIEAMVTFHHNRKNWLPDLLKHKSPASFFLKNGVFCAVQLWDPLVNYDFVGASYSDGKLELYLPCVLSWCTLSLGWLAARRCRCGAYDCDPAPFRRLRCPYAKRQISKMK
jgi:hypothetical protein